MGTNVFGWTVAFESGRDWGCEDNNIYNPTTLADWAHVAMKVKGGCEKDKDVLTKEVINEKNRGLSLTLSNHGNLRALVSVGNQYCFNRAKVLLNYQSLAPRYRPRDTRRSFPRFNLRILQRRKI